MCSTSDQRIAEIGQAIDDLAVQAVAAYSSADQPRHAPGEPGDRDQVVIGLAQLWARLAELDPEVARRLPTYEA
jgi:hypothetical protein